MKRHDVVVDIGCGSGVQIKEIGKNGYSLAIGIDVNLNAIRFARERSLPDTEFIIADSQYLPIKSSYADKIICAEIIEHIKNPQHLVNEIARVLKQDGAVVITTPNDRSVWGIYEFLWDIVGRGRNYGETHLRFFSEPVSEIIFLAFQNAERNPLFFISPVFALFNRNTLLEIGKTLTGYLNNGVGVSQSFFMPENDSRYFFYPFRIMGEEDISLSFLYQPGLFCEPRNGIPLRDSSLKYHLLQYRKYYCFLSDGLFFQDPCCCLHHIQMFCQ